MLAEPDRRPVRPLVCRWRLRLKITVPDAGGVCNCKLQLRFKFIKGSDQQVAMALRLNLLLKRLLEFALLSLGGLEFDPSGHKSIDYGFVWLSIALQDCAGMPECQPFPATQTLLACQPRLPTNPSSCAARICALLPTSRGLGAVTGLQVSCASCVFPRFHILVPVSFADPQELSK